MAAPMLPAGYTVTTVVGGVKKTRIVGQPSEPATRNEENIMPRGVYDRSKSKAAKENTGQPTARKSPAGMAAILADLRRKRDAIDAAIKALEAL